VKIFNVRNVLTVGAIMLGLVAAWNAGMPEMTSGNGFRGSCVPCVDVTSVCCPNVPNKVCDRFAVQCIMGGDGSRECYTSIWSPCVASLNCRVLYYQACVDN
jgi:hypothetical protein